VLEFSEERNEGFLFCNLLLQNIYDRIVDWQLLFIINEAFFYPNGQISKQNIKIWSEDYANIIQQV
jgi:hypothetical protein